MARRSPGWDEWSDKASRFRGRGCATCANKAATLACREALTVFVKRREEGKNIPTRAALWERLKEMYALQVEVTSFRRHLYACERELSRKVYG